jgi:transcriptional regulator with XRE-family HTH domain
MIGIDQHVADRLKALRQSRHMSPEEMARQMGVEVPTLIRFEAGHDRLAAACLVELARRFDVPVSSFFEGLQRTGSEEGWPTSSREAILSYLFGDLSDPQKGALLSLVKALTEEQETGERSHGT